MALTRLEPRVRALHSLSPHGFHRVVWYEWGPPDARDVVVCVHGVGRNGRDFDVLGEALASTHRVLAVDMPGRGRSEWLADANDYTLPTYLTTLTALIAASGAERVSWVGTSMGGLHGIAMAAQPGTPIARLVVNDVGPVIEPGALARIGTYLGANPSFATYGEIEAYVRTVSAPFGPLTDAQWAYLTRTNVRQDADGRWRIAYDPGIAVPFRGVTTVPDLWAQWDAIRCPVLVLRGEHSDLLSRDTARAMADRGPRARVLEIEGVGHAPMLLDPSQIDVVAAFLRG
ncbi:MAG TPA: alpha/beta hydrolase [Casimicrobiaceae bacterium]|jgi:pimeloyl-ACP methyl ester carboxylesterase